MKLNEIVRKDVIIRKSLTKCNLPNNMQLVGVIKEKLNSRKFIIHCDICERDPELFGDGYFILRREDITRGNFICGCNKNYFYNEEQLSVIIGRKAKSSGYNFIGFKENYKGKNTKLIMQCNKHSIWDTCSINNFLRDRGCPVCGKLKRAASRMKPDDYFISQFRDIQKYDNITFKRGDKTNMWVCKCIKCLTTQERHISQILKGAILCNCDDNAPFFTYIFSIKDSNKNLIGFKIGKTKNVDSRLQELNLRVRDSGFVLDYDVYFEYKDTRECTKAETECKSILPSRGEIPLPKSGTETILPKYYNLAYAALSKGAINIK